ncbi:hypothetical protein GCM10010972_08210 [Cellulomonas carbonis]|nr:hypothetical protein GCM10010972_08210 [Cellulomonas carbonis]
MMPLEVASRVTGGGLRWSAMSAMVPRRTRQGKRIRGTACLPPRISSFETVAGEEIDGGEP